MATTSLNTGGIALHGAPDNDIGSADSKRAPQYAMQLAIPQEIVDELVENVNNGKPLQLLFGRTPQLKYGDKSHALNTSPESYRYELYKSSGAAAAGQLEFAGLINHSLAVQKAVDETGRVDPALELLKSNMAAMNEQRQANKTNIGDATPTRTPTHRRFPSKSVRPQHLTPSSLGSPLSAPSSPARKPLTSQPSGSHEILLEALRVPVIHLLAVHPSRDTRLAETCRTSVSNVRELLPRIAKLEGEKWQLTDKSFRELKPWEFPYKDEDREQAINNAIKSFDRLRLAKDDKLWQILLPEAERNQGKCLSRLTVKAPEQRPATPLHRIKLGEKKAAATKKSNKDPEQDKKKSKEAKALTEVRPKKPVKGKVNEKAAPAKGKVNEKAAPAKETAKSNATPTPSTATPSSAAHPSTTTTTSAPSKRNTPSSEAMAPRFRTVKMPAKPKGESTASGKTNGVSTPRDKTNGVSTPREKPQGTSTPRDKAKGASTPRDKPNGVATPRDRSKTTSRDLSQKGYVPRPSKPLNTKPKNPSPLSASPPVNASDFADTHPVHKALSAAPSPAKLSSSNSDRLLKRKANDIDSDIHNHDLSVKHARVDRPSPAQTPSSTTGRTSTATPSSTNSLKRKSDDSSASDTPTNKVRKVAHIDTGLASQYPNNTSTSNSQISPSGSSSSATSPDMRLSFRQSVELAQKYQQYYKKYQELYWHLSETAATPTESQRAELMKMHKKLEEMKREIKSGAGGSR